MKSTAYEVQTVKQVKRAMLSRRKLIDTAITSLAAFLVLLGMAAKLTVALQGQWINAGGAVLFYLLMFTLFVFRRASHESLDKPRHYCFALLGTLLPLGLQLTPTHIPWLHYGALVLEVSGILLSLIALAALGRGFGIIAANRQIKTHGLYRFIRHPLYTGEALWIGAIVLQNLSLFNVLLFSIQLGCQIRRILDEESLLSHDPVYATYTQHVQYRMIPGVF